MTATLADEMALWARLDTPGYDACRLARSAGGWALNGTAVFARQSVPTCLNYVVICDDRWRTIEGNVSGWSGARVINALFTRHSGASWTLNGERSDLVDDCVDLDFGFTPATNVLQIRRLALNVGERVDLTVAWWDVGEQLQKLPQSYERLTRDTYRYTAPTVGYEAVLEVNAHGFVRRYPRLWEEVNPR
jgi:hypothetical protein